MIIESKLLMYKKNEIKKLWRLMLFIRIKLWFAIVYFHIIATIVPIIVIDVVTIDIAIVPNASILLIGLDITNVVYPTNFPHVYCMLFMTTDYQNEWHTIANNPTWKKKCCTSHLCRLFKLVLILVYFEWKHRALRRLRFTANWTQPTHKPHLTRA